MAVEVSLETIANTRDISNMNANFQRIQTALGDAVSRSGANPNTMEADFDLNSNDLLNGGAIQGDSVTTVDLVAENADIDNLDVTEMRLNGRLVTEFIVEGPPGPQGEPGIQGPPGNDGADGADGSNGIGVPVGGSSGQVLSKNSATDYDTAWIDPPETGREILSANRTYYVRSDGSDSNTGLSNTSGGAMLTIAAALALVAALDTNGKTVTVQIQDGTWTVPVVLPSVQGVTGVGQLIIQGNTGTPANCLVNVTGTPFSGTELYGSVWDIKGFKLQGTGNGIQASSNTHLRFSNIEFGAITGNQINTGNRARISALTNYTISGSALRHILNDNVSTVSINSITITITGTPAFPGGFMYTSKQSFTQALSTTFSGSATGPRMVIINSSFVETSSSASLTFWPGDSTGTWGSNSLYDGIAGITQFNGFELGDTSDTSIARTSAGEVSVEGRRVVLSNAPVTKTGDFTVAASEVWLINNKSGSSCTVTLPAASSFGGRIINIKNMQAQTVVSASSNVVPRNSTSAGTAILASGAGNWATLVSDGTNWIIMQGS